MTRESKLLFTNERTGGDAGVQKGTGELLFHSSRGIPILWLLVFGERNVWDPGDTVKTRGGAVGERPLYEINAEVAQYRLEHAESALKHDQHFWPWFSVLPILRRKLLARPKTGFLHLHAPWLQSIKKKDLPKLHQATAFAENAVNFVSFGDRSRARQMLRELGLFCPFVPLADGEDLKRFQKAARPLGVSSEALALALLSLGESDKPEAYRTVVEREVAPVLESGKKLPPPESQVQIAREESAAGVMTRLMGFLRKKS